MTNNKTFNRVHTFPNGSKIDLRKVIFIGALDKDINAGTIFLPVYVTGTHNPIKIVLGFSLGKTEETKKTVIFSTVEQFTMAWLGYLASKEKGAANG